MTILDPRSSKGGTLMIYLFTIHPSLPQIRKALQSKFPKPYSTMFNWLMGFSTSERSHWPWFHHYLVLADISIRNSRASTQNISQHSLMFFLLWFHTHPSEHGWMKWLEMWTIKLGPLRAPGWILVRGFHMHSSLPSCGLEVPSKNSFRTRAGSFREHCSTVTDCGRLRSPGALGLSDRWYERSSLFMNPREEAFQHERTQLLVPVDRSQTSSGKYGCGYSVSTWFCHPLSLCCGLAHPSTSSPCLSIRTHT